MPISKQWYGRWVAVACLSGCVSSGALGARAFAQDGVTVLTRERLSRMYTATAFDALAVLPGFTAGGSAGAQSRYVVYLDGTVASDLEVLRAIRATDLAEIRILTGPEAASGSGARAQIRITTLGTVARHR